MAVSLGVDQVAHLAHLNARDTTLAYASRAPQKDIERLKARMGWRMPWYTITDSFDKDFGVNEWHGHNVFFRDGDRVVEETISSRESGVQARLRMSRRSCVSYRAEPPRAGCTTISAAGENAGQKLLTLAVGNVSCVRDPLETGTVETICSPDRRSI